MSRPHMPRRPASEKEAWLAVAGALRQSSAPPEPDASLLAAWLEGRLDEAEAAPVESWIAREPLVASERLEALRASLAAEPEKTPPRLLLRLRAMAPVRRSITISNRRVWQSLPQAAGLAAAVMLGVFGAYGGYSLGISGALAVEQAESLVAHEALAELVDLDDDLFF